MGCPLSVTFPSYYMTDFKKTFENDTTLKTYNIQQKHGRLLPCSRSTGTVNRGVPLLFCVKVYYRGKWEQQNHILNADSVEQKGTLTTDV